MVPGVTAFQTQLMMELRPRIMTLLDLNDTRRFTFCIVKEMNLCPQRANLGLLESFVLASLARTSKKATNLYWLWQRCYQSVYLSPASLRANVGNNAI